MTARNAIAIIPLRAGSKGLPGKNTRLLAGRPLYAHAIAQAHAAGVKQVLISTDIKELIGPRLAPGVTVLPRPADLAGDEVPMDAVLSHALSHGVTGPAQVMLLQATSPLRQGRDITAAMDLHDTGEFDLVLSATQANSGVLKWGRRGEGGQFVPLSEPAHCFANRASLPPVYRPNGAVYVFDADWFRQSGTLAGGRIGMIEMPPERSHDIDTLADFETVEALLEGAPVTDE